MPRFSDEWVVSKALFEYTTGGQCSCCSFGNFFNPEGLKGLISSVSDIDTDAANDEYDAAQQSPWPHEMRDAIWSDRVRIRYKMKMEIKSYKEFMENIGEDDLKKFCLSLGAVELRNIFQMPRSEISEILKTRYRACCEFVTLICSVIDQVANFPLTKLPPDSVGIEELQFERMLKFNRFGGFILNIIEKDENDDKLKINTDVLNSFVSIMASLGGPRLLERDSSRTKQKDEDRNADEIIEKNVGKKHSFRSDRRLVRLIISKFWADCIISRCNGIEEN